MSIMVRTVAACLFLAGASSQGLGFYEVGNGVVVEGREDLPSARGPYVGFQARGFAGAGSRLRLGIGSPETETRRPTSKRQIEAEAALDLFSSDSGSFVSLGLRSTTHSERLPTPKTDRELRLTAGINF